MEGIIDEFPAAQKLTHILAFLSPRCIPKTIINGGSPELEDEDLSKTLSDDFDVSRILFTLTKLSLFEEVSENSVRVHSMVQEIIKEEVIEK